MAVKVDPLVGMELYSTNMFLQYSRKLFDCNMDGAKKMDAQKHGWYLLIREKFLRDIKSPIFLHGM